MRQFAALCFFTAIVLSGVATAAETPDPNGRYTIIFNPQVRADLFMLDTATGRVWVRSTFSDLPGSPDAWVLMDRINTPEDRTAFEQAHGSCVGLNEAALIECANRKVELFNARQKLPQ